MKQDYTGILFFGAIAAGIYFLYDHLVKTCGPTDTGLCSLYNSVFGTAVPAATTTVITSGGGPLPSVSPNPVSSVPSSVIPPTIQPTPAPLPVTVQPVPPVPATSAFATQLVNAMNQQVSRTNGTVSEWNWVLSNMVDSSKPILMNSPYAVDEHISVTQYLAARSAAGLSGYPPATHFIPMEFVHGWRGE